MRKIFYPTLSLILFLGLWIAIAWYVRQTPFLFPFPWKVFARVVANFSLFSYHALATYLEMMCGMLIASVLSFVTAYGMLKARVVKAMLEPYFVVMQCLPMFTLAPLCILWFGWSFIAIIVPTALMISLPLTMSVYRGLQSTPQQHLDFFRVHGASERILFYKVKIPFALPHIFAGLRISAAVSGVGAIAGEWAGAQRGLGVLLQMSKRNFDIEAVFGAIASLLFLNLSLYFLVVFLEKWLRKDQHVVKKLDRATALQLDAL